MPNEIFDYYENQSEIISHCGSFLTPRDNTIISCTSLQRSFCCTWGVHHGQEQTALVEPAVPGSLG